MIKLSKRSLVVFVLILSVVVGMTVFSKVAYAAEGGLKNVYISDIYGGGNDNNAGDTPSAPVLTMEKAKELVANGGNIWVEALLIITNTQIWDFTDKLGVTIKRRDNPSTLVTIMNEGKLTLKNIVFDGTMTDEDGNATPDELSYVMISVQDKGTLVMDEGSVIMNNNSESCGSAVQVINNGSFVMQKNSKIYNNQASTQYGAGLYVQPDVGGVNITIKDDAEFSNNVADCGGAIYASGKVNFEIQGGIFKNNSANYGGAIYSLSKVNISGGLFENNSAKISGEYKAKGGAVYTKGGLAISGGVFKSNSSTDYGGVVFAEAQNISVSGATFEMNTASSGSDFFVNGVTMKAPGDFGFPTGIYLNKASLNLTSALKKEICFENVSVSEYGNSVVLGDNYTLTHKDWLHISSQTNDFFEFDIDNNQITKIASQSTKHTLSNLMSDENNHWKKCTTLNCDYIGSKEAHKLSDERIINEATHTKEGSKTLTCSDCGYLKTVTIPTIAHTWSQMWSKDEAGHWHDCISNDGGCSDKIAHTLSKPSKNDGTQLCSVCGYKFNQPVISKNTLTDLSTGTKVEYLDGLNFGDSTELIVTPQKDKNINKYNDNVNKVVKGSALANIYDIKLLKNGIAIQPNGKIKISIKLTNEMKTMTDLKVVYIDNKDNITIMPSEVKDDKIVFITDHLSYYGVIGKKLNDNKGNVHTNDNSNIALWASIVCVSIGGVIIVLSNRKKLRK